MHHIWGHHLLDTKIKCGCTTNSPRCSLTVVMYHFLVDEWSHPDNLYLCGHTRKLVICDGKDMPVVLPVLQLSRGGVLHCCHPVSYIILLYCILLFCYNVQCRHPVLNVILLYYIQLFCCNVRCRH